MRNHLALSLFSHLLVFILGVNLIFTSAIEVHDLSTLDYITETGYIELVASDTADGHAFYDALFHRDTSEIPVSLIVISDHSNLDSIAPIEDSPSVIEDGDFTNFVDGPIKVHGWIDHENMAMHVRHIEEFEGISTQSHIYHDQYANGLYTETIKIRYISVADVGDDCDFGEAEVTATSNEMQEYYHRWSNGRIKTPWETVWGGCVHIDYAAIDYEATGLNKSYYVFMNQARDNATPYTGTPSTTMLFLNRNSKFGWAGLATVGGSWVKDGLKLWMNGKDDLWVAAHELGHNLGLYHSNRFGREDDYYGGGRGDEYRGYSDILAADTSANLRTSISVSQENLLRMISEKWTCRLPVIGAGTTRNFRAKLYSNDDLRTKPYLEKAVSSDYNADAADDTTIEDNIRGDLSQCVALVIPLNGGAHEIWLEYRSAQNAYGTAEFDEIYHSHRGLRATWVPKPSKQNQIGAAHVLDLTNGKNETSSDFTDAGWLMPGQRWVCPDLLCKDGDSISITAGSSVVKPYFDLEVTKDMDGIEGHPSFMNIEITRNFNTTPLEDASVTNLDQNKIDYDVLTPLGELSSSGAVAYDYLDKNYAGEYPLALARITNKNSETLEDKTSLQYYNSTGRYYVHFLGEHSPAQNLRVTSDMNNWVLSKHVFGFIPTYQTRIGLTKQDGSSFKTFSFSSSRIASSTSTVYTNGSSLRNQTSSLEGYSIVKTVINDNIMPGDIIVWITPNSSFKNLQSSQSHELWTQYGQKLEEITEVSILSGALYGTVPYLLPNRPGTPVPSLVSINDYVVERSSTGVLNNIAVTSEPQNFSPPTSAPRVTYSRTGSAKFLTIPEKFLMFRPNYVKRETNGHVIDVVSKSTSNYTVECTDMVYSPRAEGIMDIDFALDANTSAITGHSAFIWVADYVDDAPPSTMTLSEVQNRLSSHNYGTPVSLIKTNLNDGKIWTHSEVAVKQFTKSKKRPLFTSRTPVDGYMEDAQYPGFSKFCVAFKGSSTSSKIEIRDVRFMEKDEHFTSDSNAYEEIMTLDISTKPSVSATVKMKDSKNVEHSMPIFKRSFDPINSVIVETVSDGTKSRVQNASRPSVHRCVSGVYPTSWGKVKFFNGNEESQVCDAWSVADISETSIVVAVTTGSSEVVPLRSFDVMHTGSEEFVDNILNPGSSTGGDDGSNNNGGNDNGGNDNGGNNNDNGGSTDGGNTDGGNTDGGNTDGGSTDGGKTDGGNTDGGNTDTNPDPEEKEDQVQQIMGKIQEGDPVYVGAVALIACCFIILVNVICCGGEKDEFQQGGFYMGIPNGNMMTTQMNGGMMGTQMNGGMMGTQNNFSFGGGNNGYNQF